MPKQDQQQQQQQNMRRPHLRSRRDVSKKPETALSVENLDKKPPPHKGFHPTKKCRLAGVDGEVEIDEKLAEVVTLLNQLGFRTMQSCQGDAETARYIEFDIGAVEPDYDDTRLPHGSIILTVREHD